MRISVRKLALIPLFLLALFVLSRMTAQEPEFHEMPTEIVNFVALKADGSKTDYESEKGKVTLIVLSASWCPGCIMEIPMLKRLHQKYNDKGLKILMINEDDNLTATARFIRAKEIPWTVVHWNRDAANAVGSPGFIPATCLVGANNKIEMAVVGEVSEDALEKRILQLLN